MRSIIKGRYLTTASFTLLLTIHETTPVSAQTVVWQQTTLANQYAVSLVATPNGHVFAGTSAHGTYRTTDNGASWTQLTDSSIIALAADSQGDLFAAGGGVFRSTDNGESWMERDTGLTDYMVGALMIDSAGYMLVGTRDSGVFRSTDNGNHWEQTNNGIPKAVIDFAKNPRNGDYYAVSPAGVQRSTNGGLNWTQTGFTGAYGRALASSSNGTILLGISGGGVQRSTDNGGTWTSTGLVSVFSLLITSNGNIFAGGYDGIYHSKSDSIQWIADTTGLTNQRVLKIRQSPSGYLFIGTFGDGVFRSVEPITSVREDHDLSPTDFLLQQNYPNPFNSMTTIQYSLKRTSPVMLRVFDMLGREIATLADGKSEAGTHSLRWDAARVASGVYYYQLRTSSFTETKKLLLMK